MVGWCQKKNESIENEERTRKETSLFLASHSSKHNYKPFVIFPSWGTRQLYYKILKWERAATRVKIEKVRCLYAKQAEKGWWDDVYKQ
jgi:hypothetical protein